MGSRLCDRFLLTGASALAIMAAGEAGAATWDLSYDGSNIQSWTAPTTGVYDLGVWGAAGGGRVSGGPGAFVGGDVTLTKGETLSILVGGKGADWGGGFGGGGGSFVWSNSLLAAAGGGGGGGYDIRPGRPGLTTSSGGGGGGYSGGKGGVGGGGGVGGPDGGGGGGAGVQGGGSNGGQFWHYTALGASSITHPGTYVSPGGFGGGGAGGYYGGGGGGGYSGGGGGGQDGGGGGGGSFLASSVSNQSLVSGVRYGAGYVSIASVGGAVPEPATWAMLAIGFGAVGFMGVRRGKLKKAIA